MSSSVVSLFAQLGNSNFERGRARTRDFYRRRRCASLSTFELIQKNFALRRVIIFSFPIQISNFSLFLFPPPLFFSHSSSSLFFSFFLLFLYFRFISSDAPRRATAIVYAYTHTTTTKVARARNERPGIRSRRNVVFFFFCFQIFVLSKKKNHDVAMTSSLVLHL